MDLLIILKCKILIFINRLKRMSLSDKIKLIVLMLIFISILFSSDFIIVKMFKTKIDPKLVVFVLGVITIFSTPLGIRKVYDTYFHSVDNILLYTWPISTNTVVLFKHIIISLHLSIPYIIVGIPTIISFGIIQTYNISYYIISLVMGLSH